MRLLGERCRTDDDWSSLLGVLLQISLSDRPPPLDREPIYRWTVGRLPAQGLKPMRPRRRKAGEGASTKERAERQALLVGDRKTKRQRLRQVLDGAPECALLPHTVRAPRQSRASTRRRHRSGRST